MDTVIGITNASDPVILTLEIVEISFMFIFKLDSKTFEKTIKKLNGKCPLDLVEKYISLETLKKIGLERVTDVEVNLTPFLLGSKNIENIKRYLDTKDIKNTNISLNCFKDDSNE